MTQVTGYDQVHSRVRKEPKSVLPAPLTRSRLFTAPLVRLRGAQWLSCTTPALDKYSSKSSAGYKEAKKNISLATGDERYPGHVSSCTKDLLRRWSFIHALRIALVLGGVFCVPFSVHSICRQDVITCDSCCNNSCPGLKGVNDHKPFLKGDRWKQKSPPQAVD